jgi:hypothetical protein
LIESELPSKPSLIAEPESTRIYGQIAMEQHVTHPTESDLAEIEEQRSWVRNHYDAQARHKYDTLEGKLHLLQVILDSGWIESDETAKLQNLGIAFGDAMAQELGLEWVIVEDEYGHTPSLRFPGTTVIAFPRTMISKRVERGDKVDVREMFRGLCADLRMMSKNPDYQRH